jgi:hypothetical protein
MKVALLVSRPDFEQDQMFHVEPERDTAGSLKRWVVLRDFLERHGVELHTHDMYASLREPDAIIVEDPTRGVAIQIVRGLINPKKLLILMMEPPVIRNWTSRYLTLYSRLVRRVLTTNSAVADGKRIRWLPLPQPFDGWAPEEAEPFRAMPKHRFMVMLRGNKSSLIRGEQYSERRRVVRYFEERPDTLLDLYGPGWNDESNPNPMFYKGYRGYAPGTISTYAHFKYVLSMDNSRVPGLLTYDMFSAFFVGAVPVYLGAPDITNYVPADCFVDFATFANLDDLTARLNEMDATGEREEYRQRGTAFLNSPQFQPFTIERFCQRVYQELTAVA